MYRFAPAAPSVPGATYGKPTQGAVHLKEKEKGSRARLGMEGREGDALVWAAVREWTAGVRHLKWLSR